MKNHVDKEMLAQAIDGIDERYILEALAAAEDGTRKRRPHKAGRTLLLAAALTALLSMTAVAVYQYSVRDAVAEVPVPDAYITTAGDDDAAETKEPETRQTLSLNGFSDSPEYQAWLEWQTYTTEWENENPNWFADNGVDDTYYETSENYAKLYGAYAAEMGEKLDEILAKYGLTAHTERYAIDAQSQLCRALGVDTILDGYDIGGDYIYDDGSFKAVGSTLLDGKTAFYSMFVAVKGSFSVISVAAPEGEEWTYTTQSGVPVIMVLDEEWDRINIIAGLDGCYVECYFETTDQTEAEAFADCIQWETLNDLFATAEAREETAASVAAYMAEPADVREDTDGGVALVREILGGYTLTELPEKYELSDVGYKLPDDADGYGYYAVSLSYSFNDNGLNRSISFSYHTIPENDSAMVEYTEDEYTTVTPCTVNGYDAVLTRFNTHLDSSEWIYTLQWLDTDRGLVFRIDTGELTKKEILALAESVAADDPSLEANAEAYAERIAEHQAEITALEEASRAERAESEAETEAMIAAVQAEEEEALQTAAAVLGEYELGSADYTWRGSYGYPAEDSDEEGTESLVQVSKTYGYHGSYEELIDLSYFSYCDDSTGAADTALTAETFANMQQYNPAYYEEYYANAAFTTGLTVNGNDAYLITVDSGDALQQTKLVWLDKDSGLIFSLQDADDVVAAEELIALAETVQPAG